MSRRAVSTLVGVAMLIGLALAAWTVFGNDDRFADSPLLGKPMPAFTLGDIDSGRPTTVDGRGEVIVINFWAPWCVPCQTEHPLLNRLAGEYADRGVSFVGVTFDSALGESAAFLDRSGRGMRNLYDADGRVGIDYGVVGVPETFFVGLDGTVRARVVGAVDEALVRQELDKLLAESTRPGTSGP